MLDDSEIIRIADAVLKAEFEQAAYDSTYVLPRVGQDGEPAISVVARFRPGAHAIEGKSAVRALSKLRQALRESGEGRESVLRYDFPDDDRPDLSPEDFMPRR